MKALRTASQDRGVAGLQTQRAGVRRHVRPALEDNPDHPDRRAHPADVQPARHVPFREHGPHRVGLRRHRAQPFDHASHPALVEQQPVEHRSRQPLGFCIGHVAGVGRQQRRPVAPDRRRRRLERRILLGSRRAGQVQRRGPRRHPDPAHQRADVDLHVHPDLRPAADLQVIKLFQQLDLRPTVGRHRNYKAMSSR